MTCIQDQWQLRQPVYGLRQAPREWHDTLLLTLAAIDFILLCANPSLFIRRGSTMFFVLVYVDDLIFAPPDQRVLASVKEELQRRHTCTDLGELQHYLGLQITRDRAARTITLTHSYMVEQILTRFRFPFPKVQLTLLAVDHGLTAPPSDESFDFSGPYPELADVYAAAMAAQELCWLSVLLTGCGKWPHSPPVLFADNRSAVLYEEPRLVGKAKLMQLCYFLLRELQQHGQELVQLVVSEANTADIFTKALPPCDHQPFCTQLGLVSARPRLLCGDFELHPEICLVLVDWTGARRLQLVMLVDGTVDQGGLRQGGQRSNPSTCVGHVRSSQREELVDSSQQCWSTKGSVDQGGLLRVRWSTREVVDQGAHWVVDQVDQVTFSTRSAEARERCRGRDGEGDFGLVSQRRCGSSCADNSRQMDNGARRANRLPALAGVRTAVFYECNAGQPLYCSVGTPSTFCVGRSPSCSAGTAPLHKASRRLAPYHCRVDLRIVDCPQSSMSTVRKRPTRPRAEDAVDEPTEEAVDESAEDAVDKSAEDAVDKSAEDVVDEPVEDGVD
ncbi:unnamed protein product [Closterium sp. NIES-53]